MRFEYDFAKQGGAIGEIVLPQAAGNVLEGAKILAAYVVVEEALTSGGTPALTFGISGSTSRYMADAFSALQAEGVQSSAFAIELGADAAEIPVMEVATAALTAGKIALYVEVIL